MSALSKGPVPLTIRTYLDDIIINEKIIPASDWWVGSAIDDDSPMIYVHIKYSDVIYKIHFDELYSNEPTVRIFTNSCEA